MTEKQYQQTKGVRRSELWLLNPRNGGTPEKFLWFTTHPEEPSHAMMLGSVAHKFILEPDTFWDEFASAPCVDRRTKEGKSIWAEFMETLNHRTIVSADDMSVVEEMNDEFWRTPFVDALVEGAEHERLFVWTDEMTGEECKVRVDSIRIMSDGTPLIVDYKTTNDASPDGFIRKALSLGYDFQAGMYCEGVEKVLGKAPRFVFIAQEKTAPYAVNIMEADPEFIQRGKDIFRELIGIYHECKTTDNWWGYLGKDNSIGKLSLPAWASNNE